MLKLILTSLFIPSMIASALACESQNIQNFGIPFGTKELPGAMVLIDSHGKKCASAMGFADYAHQVPMNPAMNFPIASNTKMFTSKVVLQMLAEGKIQLADKAEKYFSQKTFALTRTVPNISEITVLDLLRHTSGISDYLSSPHLENSLPVVLDGPEHKELIDSLSILVNRQPDFLLQKRTFLQLSWIDRPMDQTLNDPAFILAYGVAHGTFTQPTFVPDTHASYTNTGYLLLGDIIENIDHRPIEKIFRKRIEKKLNLKHTFSLNRENRTYRIAPLVPYIGEKDFSDNYLGLVGYSDDGMVSTLADMNRFIRAYTNESNRKFFDQHVYLLEGQEPGNPKERGFSTGIMIKILGGEKVYYHTGEDAGLLIVTGYIPRCDASFSLMLNQSDDKNGLPAFQTLFLTTIKRACEGN